MYRATSSWNNEHNLGAIALLQGYSGLDAQGEFPAGGRRGPSTRQVSGNGGGFTRVLLTECVPGIVSSSGSVILTISALCRSVSCLRLVDLDAWIHCVAGWAKARSIDIQLTKAGLLMPLHVRRRKAGSPITRIEAWVGD